MFLLLPKDQTFIFYLYLLIPFKDYQKQSPRAARADNLFLKDLLMTWPRDYIYVKLSSHYAFMLVKEECANFKSKIFNETEFIQFLKLTRWHFCQVYSISVR